MGLNRCKAASGAFSTATSLQRLGQTLGGISACTKQPLPSLTLSISSPSSSFHVWCSKKYEGGAAPAEENEGRCLQRLNILECMIPGTCGSLVL